MKKIFICIEKIAIIAVIILLGILLILKIKNDTMTEKQNDELAQNIQVESEYIIQNAMNKLNDIKDIIQKDVGQNVELADSGNITSIDIYFVVKENNEYKYIVKKNEDGQEKFSIAKTSDEEGRYIVSIENLGFDKCVYTNVQDYNIDDSGVITYKNYMI